MLIKLHVKEMVFVFCAILSGCSNSGLTAGGNICEKWITEMTLDVENAAVEERYWSILGHVSNSQCESIPKELSDAARDALAGENKNRSANLMEGMTRFYGRSCMDTPANKKAISLPHTCLGDDFSVGSYSPMLDDLSVGNYLFGKVLELSIDKEQDPRSRRIILNYFLSASLIDEGIN